MWRSAYAEPSACGTGELVLGRPGENEKMFRAWPWHQLVFFFVERHYNLMFVYPQFHPVQQVGG